MLCLPMLQFCSAGSSLNTAGLSTRKVLENAVSLVHAWQIVADTTGAYRVLETSHPPTYYLPPKDVDMQQLKPSGGSSYCEWKGSASYYDAPGKPQIAWYYAKPTSSFEPIANYICFYPSKVDKATVGGETVTAQPGE